MKAIKPKNPYASLDWDAILAEGEEFTLIQNGEAVPFRRSWLMPVSPVGTSKRQLLEAASQNGCWLETNPQGVWVCQECRYLPTRVGMHLQSA